MLIKGLERETATLVQIGTKCCDKLCFPPPVRVLLQIRHSQNLQAPAEPVGALGTHERRTASRRARGFFGVSGTQAALNPALALSRGRDAAKEIEQELLAIDVLSERWQVATTTNGSSAPTKLPRISAAAKLKKTE